MEFFHPDDAATPPVIPTSRRSSAQVPAEGVQWNGGDSTNFWKKYLSGGGGSNTRVQDDEQIDPLDTRRVPNKVSVGGTESRKVGTTQRELRHVSSNEGLKEEENNSLAGKVNDKTDENTLIPIRDSSVGKGSSSFPTIQRQIVPDRPSQGASKSDLHGKLRYPVRTEIDVAEQGDHHKTPKADRLASRDDARRPKSSKRHPPILLMSEPADKLLSPVGSPTIVRSKPSPTTSGDPSNANQILRENEESAPSPAIPLVKDHDGSSNRLNANSHLKRTSTSPSANTSVDPHRAAASSGSPRRFNSRLKRRSQVSETKSGHRHHRSFSNPLRRSSPTPSRPQSVVDDRVSKADSIEDAVDAYLCSPRLSQKIRHPETGRVISFSEVGDSEGFAVFCCVGMGLTRYITAFYDELALTLRLRLITPDRPGVGESEPYPDGTGTPLGWPGTTDARCSSQSRSYS